MATGLEVPTLNQLSLLPLSGGVSYSAASIGTSGQYTTSSDFSVSSQKITINSPGIFLIAFNIRCSGTSSGDSNSQRVTIALSVNSSIGSIYSFSRTLSNEYYDMNYNGFTYMALNKNHTVSFSTRYGGGSYEISVTAIKIA